MTEPLPIGDPPRPGPSPTTLHELIRALQELLDEPGHDAAEMVGHDPPVLALTTNMLAAAVSITTADQIDWTLTETDATLLDELLGSPSPTQPGQPQLEHKTTQHHEPDGDTTFRGSTFGTTGALYPGEQDWAPFGQVVPVLGAAPGVGASVVATALTDLLAHEHRQRVLLIDGAEPATSGLGEAAAAGPVAPTSVHGIGVQQARRGPTRLARLEIRGSPVIAADMLPTPTAWLPNDGWWKPQCTVVDLGWDATRMAANPGWPPAQWLQAGTPTPTPVLVVRAARPCLTRADMVLQRLAPWVTAGQIAAPAALVVVGARRWPRGVVGVVSDRMAGLMDDAVFLGRDDAIEVGGITEAAMPARLRSQLRPVARRLTNDRSRPEQHPVCG